MSAIVLYRQDIRETWARALAKVAKGGRDYRRDVILRCADAMGPERALAIADFNRKPGQSRIARLKGLVRAERAAMNRRGYAQPIEGSPVREYLAALLWVVRVEARDRQFWKNRYQERVA